MSKRSFVLIGTAIALVVLATWLAGPWLVARLFGSETTSTSIADSFEAIGALFSGLAFVAVIVTLWLQSTELALQRQQLEMQRQELVRAANAQVELVRTSALAALLAEAKQDESHERAILQRWESAPPDEFRSEEERQRILRSCRDAHAAVRALALELEQDMVRLADREPIAERGAFPANRNRSTQVGKR